MDLDNEVEILAVEELVQIGLVDKFAIVNLSQLLVQPLLAIFLHRELVVGLRQELR